MTLSKTRDAALLGTLMLAGCAVPMNSSSQTENSTLSIHEVLEQVDRNDLRLTSYRMNSIEKFRSPEANEDTSFEVSVEFDKENLYMISEFPEGGSRIAQYRLKNGHKHTLDGCYLEVLSGMWAFIDDGGIFQDFYQVDEEMQVEDYISIPAAYLYSGNEFKSTATEKGSYVIEVEAKNAADSQVPGSENSLSFTLNKDGLLEEIHSTETGPDQIYTNEKSRRFSDYNVKMINTGAMKQFFEQVSTGQIQSGSHISLDQFRLK